MQGGIFERPAVPLLVVSMAVGWTARHGRVRAAGLLCLVSLLKPWRGMRLGRKILTNKTCFQFSESLDASSLGVNSCQLLGFSRRRPPPTLRPTPLTPPSQLLQMQEGDRWPWPWGQRESLVCAMRWPVHASTSSLGRGLGSSVSLLCPQTPPGARAVVVPASSALLPGPVSHQPALCPSSPVWTRRQLFSVKEPSGRYVFVTYSCFAASFFKNAVSSQVRLGRGPQFATPGVDSGVNSACLGGTPEAPSSAPPGGRGSPVACREPRLGKAKDFPEVPWRLVGGALPEPQAAGSVLVADRPCWPHPTCPLGSPLPAFSPDSPNSWPLQGDLHLRVPRGQRLAQGRAASGSS